MILECEKTNLLGKIFAFVIAILPFLAMYRSGVPGFSLADVVLVLCGFVVLLNLSNKVNFCVADTTLFFCGLGFLLLFLFLSSLLQGRIDVNCFIRTIRYLFYVAIVFLVSSKSNLFFLKRMIVAISLVSTCYIIIQTILYDLFGVVLHGYFSVIPLYVDGYATLDYEHIYSSIMFRPTSFFLEPAHYARYVLIALCLIFFDGTTVQTKKILWATFISFGILLSTSSQGYVIMLFLWLAFFALKRNYIESVWLRNLVLGIVVFLPLCFLALLELDFVNNTINRSFDNDSLSSNGAFGARMNGLFSFVELPMIYKIIGMGFGAVPKVWVSSFGYWLYGTGVFVTVLYLAFMIKNSISLSKSNKWVFVVFCLLFVSDDSFYSYMLIPFLTLSFYVPISQIAKDLLVRHE